MPDVSDRFFDAIKEQAAAKKLLSRDHFTIDGTLIEASASLKSFRPKDEGPPDDDPPGGSGGRNKMIDFKGQKRSNQTHASTTDPDARLARKGDGKEAKLSYAGHIMTENRHGLIVDAELTQATGTAETEAGLDMISRLPGLGRKTVGVDKGYDRRGFVEGVRACNVTPHVAQKKRHSVIDHRSTRHAGYARSQRRRKLVEERFGWMKDIGGLRKLRHRGLEKVSWIFKFTAAVCNVVMMRRLLQAE